MEVTVTVKLDPVLELGRKYPILPPPKRVKRNVGSSKRKKVLRRDRKCVYCQVRDSNTVDHVLPLSRGGNNSYSNLVGACSACNSFKGDRLPKELRWIVRKNWEKE